MRENKYYEKEHAEWAEKVKAIDSRFYNLYRKEKSMVNNGDEHKFDGGKPMWDLLPYNEVGKVVDVLTYGANKYSLNGWKDVPNAEERYFAAAMRHLVAWKEGETVDEESGIEHLAHANCCILFLMWFDEQKEKL